eukprot:CAMPEP_0115208892 /NCGR_PEP_ID=MMETSP0270-20121206/21457_1 /TAXON_ID=71861 /ORGANISM="Scrippsiella trochoidea, Strain CCMP3099" /LENGTH=435 /DNA_ID=CAMNT_0002622513 /DNA_START=47 /DNA_END=1350 /DNA_ORIENTATION=+
MASAKEVQDKAVAGVRAVAGAEADVRFSLSAALSACASGPEDGPKVWAVISGDDAGSANEVLKALSAGHKRLVILATAAKGPVSQLQVLRAMEYGDVYVAAAELGQKASGAISEAWKFEAGTSVLLLAAPEAVRSDSQWTAFSYDPRREAAGGSAFAADGAQVRKEIQGFLARESLLTLVAKRSLPCESADAGAGGLGEGLADASKTVTILYTSDTGHGEECAKAVARQCRNGGYANSAVKCSTLDAFDVGALSSEPLIVFCVATAGKGEFPGNGRGFWEKINARASEFEGKLTETKYAMFGLGDSHYWGKGTEDSRINFAKPARDLDEVLEKLGAQRLIPTGFGDDQDVDQYHTGFGEWKSQLYSRLGVDKVTASGGEDDGPVKSDEVIKTETKQLRGTLKEALDDITTGQIPFHDTKLIKSHGSYQQDDRDLR